MRFSWVPPLPVKHLSWWRGKWRRKSSNTVWLKHNQLSCLKLSINVQILNVPPKTTSTQLSAQRSSTAVPWSSRNNPGSSCSCRNESYEISSNPCHQNGYQQCKCMTQNSLLRNDDCLHYIQVLPLRIAKSKTKLENAKRLRVGVCKKNVWHLNCSWKTGTFTSSHFISWQHLDVGKKCAMASPFHQVAEKTNEWQSFLWEQCLKFPGVRKCRNVSSYRSCSKFLYFKGTGCMRNHKVLLYQEKSGPATLTFPYSAGTIRQKFILYLQLVGGFNPFEKY